ncbi:acyltransferase, partial [Vibrio breoganii]|uniref:acyltransferase n=1 Tax=Vibrio breoganii TaxID=553239 RepID=UPI001F52B6E5
MGKVVFLSNLRAIAAIAVVLLHSSAKFVTNEYFMNDLQAWWAGNIFDSSTRWCVPIFVMLSGFLLTSGEKEESQYEFYKKRLNKIFIPLIFWTA